MNISVDVAINGTKEKVWDVICDIDNAVENISGITEVEVLERPQEGLVGLKWREKRILFGREAEEVMWITHAKENEYYRTRAENHGAVYISNMIVSGVGDQTKLTMNFSGEAQGFVARIMSAVMGIFFKSSMVKAVKQDLEDIKAVVEGRPDPAA